MLEILQPFWFMVLGFVVIMAVAVVIGIAEKKEKRKKCQEYLAGKN